MYYDQCPIHTLALTTLAEARMLKSEGSFMMEIMSIGLGPDSESSRTFKWFYLSFFNGPLFVYFRFFQQQFYENIVDFSGIQTRINREEGEHADQFFVDF